MKKYIAIIAIVLVTVAKVSAQTGSLDEQKKKLEAVSDVEVSKVKVMVAPATTQAARPVVHQEVHTHALTPVSQTGYRTERRKMPNGMTYDVGVQSAATRTDLDLARHDIDAARQVQNEKRDEQRFVLELDRAAQKKIENDRRNALNQRRQREREIETATDAFDDVTRTLDRIRRRR